ncbi:protein of integral membrane protein, Mpv17/PMP23 family [Pseudohyphozyma bogoriensis]|nr:protein of integral membrane protein, Mpv17/PMP23 family [Pseudohyphozyma bogoriensis]
MSEPPVASTSKLPPVRLYSSSASPFPKLEPSSDNEASPAPVQHVSVSVAVSKRTKRPILHSTCHYDKTVNNNPKMTCLTLDCNTIWCSRCVAKQPSAWKRETMVEERQPKKDKPEEKRMRSRASSFSGSSFASASEASDSSDGEDDVGMMLVEDPPARCWEPEAQAEELLAEGELIRDDELGLGGWSQPSGDLAELEGSSRTRPPRRRGPQRKNGVIWHAGPERKRRKSEQHQLQLHQQAGRGLMELEREASTDKDDSPGYVDVAPKDDSSHAMSISTSSSTSSSGSPFPTSLLYVPEAAPTVLVESIAPKLLTGGRSRRKGAATPAMPFARAPRPFEDATSSTVKAELAATAEVVTGINNVFAAGAREKWASGVPYTIASATTAGVVRSSPRSDSNDDRVMRSRSRSRATDRASSHDEEGVAAHQSPGLHESPSPLAQESADATLAPAPEPDAFVPEIRQDFGTRKYFDASATEGFSPAFGTDIYVPPSPASTAGGVPGNVASIKGLQSLSSVASTTPLSDHPYPWTIAEATPQNFDPSNSSYRVQESSPYYLQDATTPTVPQGPYADSSRVDAPYGGSTFSPELAGAPPPYQFSESTGSTPIPYVSVTVPPKQLNPLLGAYLRSLGNRPVFTKSCTSAILSFISEIAAGELSGQKPPPLSAKERTGILPVDLAKRYHKALKMAGYGFFISAPLGHTLLALLQKVFAGKTSARAKVLMILASNICISPIQQSVYIAAMAIIAGAKSPDAVLKAWKASFLAVMKITWVVSTLSMAFAQKFLPGELWVPFFTSVGAIVGTTLNVQAKKRQALIAKAKADAEKKDLDEKKE